jgi:hypothetical protein
LELEQILNHSLKSLKHQEFIVLQAQPCNFKYMKHFYQETDATEIENQHNQQIKHQIAG